MPYGKMSEVNKAVRGIKPAVTLPQANRIAEWADAIDDETLAWPIAIAQFKRLYKSEGGKWALRKEKEMGTEKKALQALDDAIAACARTAGRIALGGPGSGNWAHAGRPGVRGGSQSRSQAMTIEKGRDWLQRYEAAAGQKHPLDNAPKTLREKLAEVEARLAPFNKKMQEGINKKNELENIGHDLSEKERNGEASAEEVSAALDRLYKFEDEFRAWQRETGEEMEKLYAEQAELEALIKEEDRLKELENFVPTDISDSLIGPKSGKYKTAYEEAMATIDSVHGDGELDPLKLKTISSNNYDGVYKYSYSGEPISIGVSGKSTEKEATLTHEVGHWLDHQALGGKSGFLSVSYDSDGSVEAKAMGKVFNSLNNSAQIRRLRDGRANPESLSMVIELGGGRAIKVTPSRGSLNYFLMNQEMWARAYAQYIAIRSGNSNMLVALNAQVNAKDYTQYSQWTAEDFEPIAEAIDELMEVKGWLR